MKPIKAKFLICRSVLTGDEVKDSLPVGTLFSKEFEVIANYSAAPVRHSAKWIDG
jgi:hypothetical protein